MPFRATAVPNRLAGLAAEPRRRRAPGRPGQGALERLQRQHRRRRGAATELVDRGLEPLLRRLELAGQLRVQVPPCVDRRDSAVRSATARSAAARAVRACVSSSAMRASRCRSSRCSAASASSVRWWSTRARGRSASAPPPSGRRAPPIADRRRPGADARIRHVRACRPGPGGLRSPGPRSAPSAAAPPRERPYSRASAAASARFRSICASSSIASCRSTSSFRSCTSSALSWVASASASLWSARIRSAARCARIASRAAGGSAAVRLATIDTAAATAPAVKA